MVQRERQHLRIGLLLFLASLLVYNLNLREISSGDTAPTRLLPAIIVLEHRLYLDSFFRGYPADSELPYWAQRVGDHYLSTYAILPALLAVPIYFVPVQLWGAESWEFVNLLSKVSASVFAALSVLFVYLAISELGRGSGAIWMTLAYAFGTSTWSVSSQGLWGHGPAQFLMAAAMYFALRGDSDGRFFDGVGIATSLMVSSRFQTAFVGAALIAYVFHRDPRRGARCLLLFTGATLPFLLYNLWNFGSVQGAYGHVQALHGVNYGMEDLWSTPLGEGLLGLLISPSRGLMVYSPVLVFGLVGVVLSLRDHHRHFFHYLAVGFGASLMMLSKFLVWWGGHSFGPRYLVDLLPLLAVFLVPVWERLERARPLKAAWCFLLVISIVVQTVGVFYYPSPRHLDWNTSPQDVNLAHDRLWDWKDPQLLRLLRNGPRPPGFGLSQ